ncbi:MAG: YfhO family protein [Chloroflexi bacterium]|nr:YfhO family protein [Chloroflexota bacterium]MCL5025334.1 YfhO family protein [Chloroflexota bacterium]
MKIAGPGGGEGPAAADTTDPPGSAPLSAAAAALRKAFASGRVKDLAALLVVLVCVLIFFKDAVLFDNIYWEPDTITFYYPATRQLEDALRHGTLQLWTPYIFGGFHLFADGESGALYPPRVLALLLLSAEEGSIWLRVLRFFLAGASTYFFVREIGLRRYAAIISALVFSLGSFLVAQLHHTNVGNTAIWLPLILLFVEKAFNSLGLRRYIFLSLAGLGLGFADLAVHLQPVLLTMFALGAYAAFRAFTVPASAVPWNGFPRHIGLPWPARRAGAFSRPNWLTATIGQARRWAAYAWPRLWFLGQVGGVVAGVGAGLAAAQLVPLYELTRYSFRGYRLMYDFAVTFSASPHNLLTLLFPYFFRTAGGDPWSLWTFWETTIYVGVAPLALAIIAVLFARNRYIVFFGILGLLALLLSFGDYLPLKVYWLFWNVPPFSFVRAPGRFIFLFVISMAVLAGFGAQWLVDNLRHEGSPAGKRARRAVATFTLAFAAFGGALAIGMVLARNWIIQHGPDTLSLINAQYMPLRRGNYLLNPDMVYRALIFNLDLGNPKTHLAFILVAATVVILAGWTMWPRGRAMWRALLLGLIATDLLVFASAFHPLMPGSNLTTPTPAGKFLIERNGLHRVYTRWPAIGTETNRMLPYGVASIGGYSSLEPERHRDYMRYIERGNYRLLDLMNVKYVVATKDATGWQRAGYKIVFEDSEVRIYENPSPLPRAMLVPTVVIARSFDSVPDWLVDRDFDPTKTAIVEEAQSPFRDQHIQALVRPPLAWAEAAKAPSPGRAEVTGYEAQRVRVHTQADKDSFLLLTDSYHNGWRVYVDGQPQKLYLADYLFRGVYVPAGDHTVEFVFDPLSVKVGAAISLLVLAGLVFLWTAGWLRLRKKPSL